MENLDENEILIRAGLPGDMGFLMNFNQKMTFAPTRHIFASVTRGEFGRK